ncbi:MAG: carbon-nitrogen hydrolase family protein [Hydrogenophaga sp.]|uniref:carbon-nitrogen hydrolase family protein n=1 Tax=Hydrogenophaga sp. TaxID=1904254 RepID=UPI0025BBFEA3|nr:carbon-nitrogen hydrolase family protein [Hydrogenophaga sp.]MBT9552781.1 carbon-nitrogen hydrolase family protein [Hydrogenophaga sp.]
MLDLTLALWQTGHAPTTAEALQRLDATAARARAQGADLLIAPEMGLTGYAIGAERVAALAEPRDGPLAQAVAAIAQRHGIAIAYGYPEQNPAGRPFNAAQVIAPDGARLMNYRKTHLFGDLDRTQFSAGDAASQAFTWRGWCLGLLICYDVEFPEAVRGLALQGADAVLVPTANMEGFDEVQHLLVPARACENGLYVAYANACGSEGPTRYGGLSLVANARGEPMATAGRHETLLVVALSKSHLVSARRHSQLPHRRPALYRPLTLKE